MPTVRTKLPPPTSNDGKRFVGLPPHLTELQILQMLPNAELCDRIDASTFMQMDPVAQSKILDKYLLKRGVPLVIDNMHTLPDWPAMFSLKWLERNWEGKIPVKNMYDGAVGNLSMEKYLRNMGVEAAQITSENCDWHNLARHYAKDLDCPEGWQRALEEFLPEAVHYMGSNDLMATLPEEKRPANLMLYIGAEGTYTPIHTDMCGTLGHNLIVDAAPSASALWLIVPASDRPTFHAYLASLSIQLKTERYLLSLADWAGYPGKLYLVSQRKGDFTLIPSMSAHQVWNRGGGTCKVAWNRTTAGTLRNALAAGGHCEEYRSVCRDEQFMVRQTVQDAAISLFNGIVRQLRSGRPRTPAEQKTANDFLLLFHLFSSQLRDEKFPDDKPRPPIALDAAAKYEVVCSFCRANIWNTFLTCADCSNVAEDDSFDICLECYCEGRSCQHLAELTFCCQQEWETLLKLYRKFLAIALKLLSGARAEDMAVYSLDSPTPTLASLALSALQSRPNKKSLDLLTTLTKPDVHLTPSQADTLAANSTLCHFCVRQHLTHQTATCTCGASFCYDILRLAFGTTPLAVARDSEEWDCPLCQGSCFCKACRKEKGEGAGRRPREVVLGVNYALVAHPLARNWLVEERRGNERFLRGEGGRKRHRESLQGNGGAASRVRVEGGSPGIADGEVGFAPLLASTNPVSIPTAPTAPMAPIAPIAPTALPPQTSQATNPFSQAHHPTPSEPAFSTADSQDLYAREPAEDGGFAAGFLQFMGEAGMDNGGEGEEEDGRGALFFE